MIIEDIHFSPRLPLEEHPRFAAFHESIGLRDFAAYREVFERGWAELSILSGEGVRLDRLPVSETEPHDSPLANLMGVNSHAPKRVKFAAEFLGEYERLGRKQFMRAGKAQTAYFQDLVKTAAIRTSGLRGPRRLVAQFRMNRNINYRVSSFLTVYENMKRFGSLVGDAHEVHTEPPPLRPMDVPWAIDYHGYIKLRDGAHRRAAARGLGWPTIPTLVFDFGSVDSATLENAHPYIRDNFSWFSFIVNSVALGGATASLSTQ